MVYPNIFSPEFWIIVRSLHRPTRWEIEKLVVKSFNFGPKKPLYSLSNCPWEMARPACWECVAPEFVDITSARRIKITDKGREYIEYCKNLPVEDLPQKFVNKDGLASILLNEGPNNELDIWEPAWIYIGIISSLKPLKFTEKGINILEANSVFLAKNWSFEEKIRTILLQHLPKSAWGDILPRIAGDEAEKYALILRDMQSITKSQG